MILRCTAKMVKLLGIKPAEFVDAREDGEYVRPIDLVEKRSSTL